MTQHSLRRTVILLLLLILWILAIYGLCKNNEGPIIILAFVTTLQTIKLNWRASEDIKD